MCGRYCDRCLRLERRVPRRQTNANLTKFDEGNVNPYTGSAGTKVLNGLADDVQNGEQDNAETERDSQLGAVSYPAISCTRASHLRNDTTRAATWALPGASAYKRGNQFAFFPGQWRDRSGDPP